MSKKPQIRSRYKKKLVLQYLQNYHPKIKTMIAMKTLQPRHNRKLIFQITQFMCNHTQNTLQPRFNRRKIRKITSQKCQRKGFCIEINIFEYKVEYIRVFHIFECLENLCTCCSFFPYGITVNMPKSSEDNGKLPKAKSSFTWQGQNCLVRTHPRMPFDSQPGLWKVFASFLKIQNFPLLELR